MEQQRNTVLIVMERGWDLGIKSAEGLYRQKRALLIYFFGWVRKTLCLLC